MHLLRHHFRKPSPIPQIPTLDDVPRLPTELLILISSFIRQRGDLVILCRVSKKFRSIYTPLLYKVLVVDTRPKAAKYSSGHRLYKALRSPDISCLVTSLDFDLKPDMVCEKLAQAGMPDYMGRCGCSGSNDVLRKAIVLLKNLESLKIHCTLCSGSHGHDYLFNLALPLLRQFRFRCYATSSQKIKKSILLLPFMAQITSLSLECGEDRICPNKDDSHQTLVERTDVVPNLHTLNVDGRRLPDHLLSHRPIERLCLNGFLHRVLGQNMSGLHTSISQSPGNLSHLFSIDLLQWLPAAITRNPEPYRHLRYVGTITILHSANVSDMDNLAPLCNLEVLEVNRLRAIRSHYTDGTSFGSMLQPGHGFFETLRGRHPLLRRVLLICRHRYQFEADSFESAEPVLWEKTDSQSWNARSVPDLDYWEILHDKLDEV